MSDWEKNNAEEEYFAREETEAKRRLAIKVRKETNEAERDRLKDLHFMRCPKCGMQLHEVKYHQVDVDVCFSCGGMFLEKDEVEALAKRDDRPGAIVAFLHWLDPESRRR